MFRNRVIVSFEGKCEMNCKHCFALEQELGYMRNDVEKVVASLSNKEFDIIYVSHNKENFVCQEEGVELCEKLYEKYDKDICITSRCVLNDHNLNRMVLLDKKMKKKGKRIYWCESVPALESASIIEDLSRVPSPQDRIDFLGELRAKDMSALLSIRPLFPNEVISNKEIERLVEVASKKVDAIITGGIITTEQIDKRLGLNQDEWIYMEGNESEYLIGAIGENARFVDVRKEILNLKRCSEFYGIKFFEHSMEAINYLANK